MGRSRKVKADNRLPPYVYLAKGRYVFRHYQDGKLGKEVVLCKAGAALSDVWKAYEAVQADAPRRTLAWIIDQYLGSADYKRLALSTQKDYQKYRRHLCEAKLRNGSEFGQVALDSITPGVLRKYMDKRSEKAVVQANRELAFLSAVFSWARERDIVKTNPAQGVRRNIEKPRDVYVTDDDYLRVYRLAGERYPYLQPLMELAYLCRMRLAEVLDLTRANLRPEGLHVVRRKGSRDNITLWTPRLRAAVDLALAQPRACVHLDDRRNYLLPGRDGGRLKETTVQTAWHRLIREALERGLAQRFTIHDLKAKGVTDTDRADQLAASGHKSQRMLNVYDRLPQPVKPSGKE
jgi:integrase